MLSYDVLCVADCLELFASTQMLISIQKRKSYEAISVKGTLATFISYLIPYIGYVICADYKTPIFYRIIIHTVRLTTLLILLATIYTARFIEPLRTSYKENKD